MWELDHKEGWAQRNWHFWTVVLQKTLESLLDHKEIKPVNPRGNQPCIFTGRTKAVVAILWPPDTKSQLIGIDPDAGKDWGQKEKGVAGDEMVGWHHQLSGHDFDETPRNRKRQKSLDCCSPWVTKSQTWLNYWTTTAMGFWKSSCLTGW